MTQRVFNFSAGPAALPLPVLQQAQKELLELPGAGASVMELSHRGKPYMAVHEGAKQGLAELLKLPENYKILFLQGGARLQFAMIPMNLMQAGGPAADYVVTGTWSKSALGEAQLLGPTRTVYDSKPSNFNCLPQPGELSFNPEAPYAYITSNETIQGVQFPEEPDTGDVPLVCDASSDFLSRPLDISKYGLIYACAQKNAGPAGVTIVVIRDDLIGRSGDKLPTYLSYKVQAENDSLYNTPPTFAVYVVGLVARWLLDEIGGLEKMQQINKAKAKMLYEAIDQSGGFYDGHALPECRSDMNVAFRLPDDELTAQFLKEGEQQGLSALKGHRSVGGIRASIYNAMPVEGVEKLRDFMRRFAEQHAK